MAEIIQIKAGSNCYLITEGASSILIDTGMQGAEKRILKQCEGKNVKLIVLTHGHIDHIQNALYLSRKLNVPIAMNEKDIPLIQNNLCRDMKAKGIIGNIVHFFSVMGAKFTHIEAFQPDILLQEGNSLNKYGINARIVELPGHTAGSIGVVLNNKEIFVGDALMHMTTAGPSLLFEDYKQMLESVRRIQNMGNLIVYYGHGRKMITTRC